MLQCKRGHDISDDSKVTLKTVRGQPYRYCKQCLSLSNKKYRLKAKDKKEVDKVATEASVAWKVEGAVRRNDYPGMMGAPVSSSLNYAKWWANTFKVPYIVYTEVLPDFMMTNLGYKGKVGDVGQSDEF